MRQQCPRLSRVVTEADAGNGIGTVEEALQSGAVDERPLLVGEHFPQAVEHVREALLGARRDEDDPETIRAAARFALIPVRFVESDLALEGAVAVAREDRLSAVVELDEEVEVPVIRRDEADRA